MIAHTLDECLAAADELGYPMVVRPSFTMGGSGSGMAYDEADLRQIAGVRARGQPHHRGAPGGVDPRLEGVRAGGDARHQGQRRDRLLDREPRPDGRAHRRLDHGRAGDDAHRPRVPAPARPVDRHHPRGRRGHRRLQHPVRGEPRRRPGGRDRDEPAGVAVLGAGLEGDRLPDRQDRREGGDRLHPRRDPQRHHPRRRPASRSSRRWTTSWSRCRGSRSRSSPAPTRR